MYQNNNLKSATPSFSVADALLDSSLIAQINTIKYNIKLINCNGFIQIYEYPNIRIKKDKNKEGISEHETFDIEKYLNMYEDITIKNEKDTEKLSELKIVRKDNVLRSKLSVERLIKSNIETFKSFLTLTFADNIKMYIMQTKSLIYGVRE